MTTDQLVLPAYAKINLTLEVLGRRSDGYHDLASVMQTISLADTVTLVPGGEGFEVEAPDGWDVPIGSDNLVARALEAFGEACGNREPRVGIRLHKRIPSAAGLGGGSSDAAAALRGLNALGGGALTEHVLEAVAARLGSDVPFFLRGGTQLVEGRGERPTPLPDIEDSWLVLVTPPIALERKTAHLFGLLRPADWSDGSATRALTAQLAERRRVHARLLFNTFDRVADAALPGLDHYRSALVQVCGHAVLAGAGPSLFALCNGEGDAGRALHQLVGLNIPASIVRTVSATKAVVTNFV